MALKKVILNGSHAIVPASVAEMYRRNGHTVMDLADKKEKVHKDVEVPEEPEKVENAQAPEEPEHDLVEKPISKWTQAELKMFAEENGISTEGGAAKTKKRVIEFLKAR